MTGIEPMCIDYNIKEVKPMKTFDTEDISNPRVATLLPFPNKKLTLERVIKNWFFI